MKIAIAVLLLVALAIPAEPTIAPLILNDQSISTAAACDEFHGDFNCTCEQSIFDPCCPWWEPWKCPRPDLVVQTAEQKQRTKVWVERIDRAIVYVDALAAVSSVYCAASNENDMCAWASTYIQIAVGLRVARKWINMTDPFDPNYRQPYYPAGGTLGLSCEDGPLVDYCTWMANRLQYVSMFWDGVYNSINRSQSCADRGQEDCYSYQRDRMLYFLWAAGIHLEGVAYGMAVASDAMLDGESANNAWATSGELYVVADEMKGECPWC
jgi:hypothetical protein